MRVILSASILLASASCTTPPCTTEDCARECYLAQPDQPAVAIDPFTASKIDALLQGLRAGPQATAADASFCSPGAKGTCSRRLRAPDAILPRGEWVLEFPYTLPELTENWEATLAQQCVHMVEDELGLAPRREPTYVVLDVEVDAKNQGVFRGPTVEVPSQGGPRKCAWRITLMHGDFEDFVVEGRFLLPAEESLLGAAFVPTERSAGDAQDETTGQEASTAEPTLEEASAGP